MTLFQERFNRLEQFIGFFHAEPVLEQGKGAEQLAVLFGVLPGPAVLWYEGKQAP